MNLDKPRREQFRKKYHYNISHIKEYVIIPNIEQNKVWTDFINFFLAKLNCGKKFNFMPINRVIKIPLLGRLEIKNILTSFTFGIELKHSRQNLSTEFY